MIDDLASCGVYTITNVNDGRGTIYVGGTTTSFRTRWRHHINCLQRGDHGNLRLQRAWNKYGEWAFEFTIVEAVTEPNQIDEREQYWLNHYRSTQDVYNMAIVVGRPPTHGFSEETRRKISEAARGRSMSESTKRKISITLKGRKMSREHRRKIGNASRGRKHTKESKRRMSLAHRGVRPTDETRQKMSAAHQGRPSAMRGRKHSEKTKEKISAAMRGREMTNEWKQKISAALKDHAVSEETREKIGNANSRPYPAFFNFQTGRIIPAGRNLKALCEKCNLSRRAMWAVMNGKQSSHKGWILYTESIN